jgi:replicative DNA helicase
MLDEAESNLFDITQKNLNRRYTKLGDLAVKAQKELESLSKKVEGMTGVPSGFTELDRITNGWQRSDLIIVAARPGMGKTAFTLALARNAALDFNKPVAFFSLEMSALQLTHRLMSMVAEIPGTKLRNAQLEDYEWQQLNTAVERFSEVPIYIDDTPAINIFELRAKCRRLKMHHDIQLIVVDYLQLMAAGPDQKRGGTREQEISTISRALKTMAKELDVPVIALSQLSRAVETRGGNKRPQLSDLRDSGAIEQDADIVLFIYRPDYYEMEADPTISKDQAEIMISKHRNGALGTVNLKFISQFAKFTDPSDDFFTELAPKGPTDNYNSIITRPSRINEDDEPIPF